MVALSKKRLVVYLLLIGSLVAVWLSAEFGVLPERAARSVAIFRPPNRAALNSLHLDGAGDGNGQRGASVTPDPFETDLRDLIARGAASGQASDGEPPTPVPTATPTETPQPVTQDTPRAQPLQPDDGRGLFSELQPAATSSVSDPLGGVVIRGPGPVRPVVTPELTPSGRSWVSGQARGYTMLYAMQPQARPVVEANVQALLGSRVREPYIGVLIDGTFSRDFSYLKDVVTRLSAEGRELTLVLYLSNGPTMRKWEVTPIDQHIFARISPEEFRLQIRRNMSLRAEFFAVVLQAKDVFAHNLSLGPNNTNVAIVMLEDNLDVLAYRALREIAAEQLGPMAGFMRNPCIGCHPGNDDDTLGDAREEHQLERFDILKAGDGYSLDGVGFRYPNGEGSGVAADQVTDYIEESLRRGLRFFGLWQENWQGVRDGIPNKRPEDRTYLPSSPDQQAFEVELLRLGLIREDQEESADETSPSP